MKLLLEKGAELESRDNYGQTPLSQAAENDQETMVKLLLEKGAELESRDKYGWTFADVGGREWARDDGGASAVAHLISSFFTSCYLSFPIYCSGGIIFGPSLFP